MYEMTIEEYFTSSEQLKAHCNDDINVNITESVNNRIREAMNDRKRIYDVVDNAVSNMRFGVNNMVILILKTLDFEAIGVPLEPSIANWLLAIDIVSCTFDTYIIEFGIKNFILAVDVRTGLVRKVEYVNSEECVTIQYDSKDIVTVGDYLLEILRLAYITMKIDGNK